jgi:AsmA-like C-terminal region
MTPTRPSIHHRRRLFIALGVVGAVVALLVVAVLSIVPVSSETARTRVVAALAAQLNSEVELETLHIRILPQLRAEGTGLTIRHKGRRDVPPLISITRFTAEGSVLGVLRRHLSAVVLEGLDIEIPPDHNRDADDTADDTNKSTADEESKPSAAVRAWVIDALRSTNARLVIIPSREGKEPKVWAIHDLKMQSVSAHLAMPFQATLTNAVPPGEIGTTGRFGPWHSEQPGRTPVEGTFTFDHADLGVFKGISGILSARGDFGGTLERMDIHGNTDTPQFTLSAAGHPIPLHASYHAIVDGTNGDTRLERIDASFLETALVAKGAVVGAPGQHGRTVSLDVTIERGRLEDVLRLAVKTPEPPMSGALTLHTMFLLPPGDRDVVEKLQLDGRFTINGTRFTNFDIQRKINELSHRGSGKDPEERRRPVSSTFTGRFKLANGTLRIPAVVFDVPGAIVRLSGIYDLQSETLDFAGMLLMNAKVSETTKGFKSVLLKMIDPLFERPGGGSAIPIKITGYRSDPSFGIDKGRIFNH